MPSAFQLLYTIKFAVHYKPSVGKKLVHLQKYTSNAEKQDKVAQEKETKRTTTRTKQTRYVSFKFSRAILDWESGRWKQLCAQLPRDRRSPPQAGRKAERLRGRARKPAPAQPRSGTTRPFPSPSCVRASRSPAGADAPSLHTQHIPAETHHVLRFSLKALKKSVEK